MQNSLLLTTARLLRDRPKSLSLYDLAQELSVSVSWLSSLLSDDPPEGASVTKVEKLYNRLAPSPLNLSTTEQTIPQKLNW